MDRTRPHSNAWEDMHYMQEDYEMTHFMSKSEYLEGRETYGLYTTNEDKWQPRLYSNCYSIAHLVEEFPLRPTMIQPTPCYIYQSYEHQVVGCHSLQAMRKEFMNQENQHKP